MKTKKVKVGGETYVIRKLGAKDGTEIEMMLIGDDGKARLGNLGLQRLKLIERGVVNEKGERRFSLNDDGELIDNQSGDELEYYWVQDLSQAVQGFNEPPGKSQRGKSSS